MSILNIRMQSGMIDCFLCGQPSDQRWGVPTVNGDVVSNNFPDDLVEGGQSVCEECFNKHERGEIPTFDRYYVPRVRSFIHGDGI